MGGGSSTKVTVRPFEAGLQLDVSTFQVEFAELKLVCEALGSTDGFTLHRGAQEVELPIPAEIKEVSGVLRIKVNKAFELENPFDEEGMVSQSCSIHLLFALHDEELFVPVYGMKVFSTLEDADVTSLFVERLRRSRIIIQKVDEGISAPFLVQTDGTKYQVGYRFKETRKKEDEFFPL